MITFVMTTVIVCLGACVAGACELAFEAGLFTTAADLVRHVEEMEALVENAFDIAIKEPKITSRENLIRSNSSAMVASAPSQIRFHSVQKKSTRKDVNEGSTPSDGRPEVMRKQMTRVFDEVLAENADVAYIGEDVEHGGYYLVTDGLAGKYPGRVKDFPPDETTLIGAAIGYAQVGLVPIVEIPYAKYLDCGADMFYEAVIAHWLSNGSHPNGMIIRLQGFDRGKWHIHTTNHAGLRNRHLYSMLVCLPSQASLVETFIPTTCWLFHRAWMSFALATVPTMFARCDMQLNKHDKGVLSCLLTALICSTEDTWSKQSATSSS
jgi:2-oxoisovalerate dehydrogenase E1 component